jgi:hypothetical protein
MGYTHYWNQSRDFTFNEWPQICEDFGLLLKDVEHVQGIPLANGMGERGTSPEFTHEYISFNGAGDDAFETFTVHRIRPPKEEWQLARGGDFCKTREQPYDLAVTAALCYLSTVPDPAAFAVNSDGHGKDFLDGLAEARRALPRYANILDIPMGVMQSDRWCMPWVRCYDSTGFDVHFCVDGKGYVEQIKTGVPEGKGPFYEAPVFNVHTGYVSVLYSRLHIGSAQRFPEARRLTPEDIEALDMLNELASDPELRLDMNFMPGDIQFLHNHTILHARSAYEDWPEIERKRHLLRLWLAPPGARPLPPVFAECYGDLTIGDRGGIICKGTRLHAPLMPD